MNTKLELLREFCKQNKIQMEILPMGVRLKLPEEKDSLDGAEFCKHVSGTHYKIDRIENQYIFTSSRSILIDTSCEPVSEEVYVNWLKSEVVRILGDIKLGDKFIEPSGDEWEICPYFKACGNEEWYYDKRRDELWCHYLVVYRKGKWAERVKERIEIKFIRHDYAQGDFFSEKFSLEFRSKNLRERNYIKMGNFLAKQLEAYLNDEIEPKKVEGFEESIKESLKKVKILKNHDPDSYLRRCDICGSPELSEESEKGTRCYNCHPEKK